MEQESSEQKENNEYHISGPEEIQVILKEAKDRLVVVHFHSDESQPSKEMVPKCKELAEANKDVVFMKVDIGQKDLAKRYNVSMTPTFLFFKGGNEMEVITGANERRLEELIHKLKH